MSLNISGNTANNTAGTSSSKYRDLDQQRSNDEHRNTTMLGKTSSQCVNNDTGHSIRESNILNKDTLSRIPDRRWMNSPPRKQMMRLDPRQITSTNVYKSPIHRGTHPLLTDKLSGEAQTLVQHPNHCHVISTSYGSENNVGWHSNDLNTCTMEDDNQANRHKMSDWLRRWLKWLKKYYLFAHYVYIILVALIASVIFYLAEDVSYADALFEAASCVTNTGMAVVNLSRWGAWSITVRFIAMVMGGMVFASAWTPLIRLVMLYRLEKETEIDINDDASLVAWKKKKKMFVERLETMSIISAGLTYLYFFFFQLICFIILALNLRNDTKITTYHIVCWVIGPFQNYGIGIEYVPTDVVSIVTVAALVAGGSSLYPVFLRYLFHGMRRSILLRRWVYKKWLKHKKSTIACPCFRSSRSGVSSFSDDDSLLSNVSNYGDGDDDGNKSDFSPGKDGITTVGGGRLTVKACSFDNIDEDVDSLLDQGNIQGLQGGCISHINNLANRRCSIITSKSPKKTRQSSLRRRASVFLAGPAPAKTIADIAAIPHLVYYDNYWDSDRYKDRSRWEKGINTIVHTQNPSIFHPLLFNWSDTHYLLLAFMFIAVFQMIPFLPREWNGVLKPWENGFSKVMVAFSQSVYVRFSGISIINANFLSNIHVCWIIFAMYIPVIPIPNLDRSRIKWKQMIKAGALRLITSRIFLLFMSMSIIVWIEEDRLYASVRNSHFDVMTRTLFDVISCYATSGMSIPAPDTPNAAFASEYSNVSKLILSVVMVVGRHRWMEMGLDVGLNELEESERAVEALLLGKNIPSVEIGRECQEGHLEPLQT